MLKTNFHEVKFMENYAGKMFYKICDNFCVQLQAQNIKQFIMKFSLTKKPRVQL